MTKKQLIELQQAIVNSAVRQGQLGGYSTDAPVLHTLMRWQLMIVDHLLEQFPKESKPKVKKRG